MDFSLRTAKLSDIDLIFEWRNLPEIIDLSSSQRKVTYREHIKWFLNIFENEDKIIYIIQLGEKPIGQIRFEKIESKINISIYLIPEEIGKGIGSQIIIKSIEEIKNKWSEINYIEAKIREENIRSQKSFLKAGFTFLRKDVSELYFQYRFEANESLIDEKKNISLYDSLHKTHGDTYRALNWGSKESQEKRFQVLTEIGIKQGDTVLDVGCGLADYYSWLTLNLGTVGYQGIDITPSMVEACKKKYPGIDFSIGTVFNVLVEPSSIDYVVASGIFYLRKEKPQYYLEKTIVKMFSIAKKGIAFNSLSTWTQKQELSEFYADPLLVVKFCQSLSNKVVLRHDYHPGDFTIYLYH